MDNDQWDPQSEIQSALQEIQQLRQELHEVHNSGACRHFAATLEQKVSALENKTAILRCRLQNLYNINLETVTDDGRRSRK